MTDSQRAWLDRYADRWVIPVDHGDQASQIAPQPPLDLAAIFGRSGDLVVEVGSGHGETLVAAALARPDCDFLGFEVFEAAIGATLGKIADHGLTNVRLVMGDAVPGLAYLLPPGSIDELWVFFPDPWPKKRHHKRRLVTAGFVELAGERLKPGGRLRLATDWDDYADAMTTVMAQAPGLRLASTDRFATRPITRFERRGLASGRTIHDFQYDKVGS